MNNFDFSNFTNTKIRGKAGQQTIELFDEHGNNVFWGHQDGRYYMKTYVLTAVGYKNTSVSGYRMKSGKLEWFWRSTKYDLKTGAVIQEFSCDKVNDLNVYRKKIGEELETKHRNIPPSSSSLF